MAKKKSHARKPAKKAGHKAKKTAAKGNARAENIEKLASEAEKIIAELAVTRPVIFENERIEKGKIEQKIALEDELAELLKRNFAQEKSFLAKARETEEEKQKGLKEKISALERIMAIYNEKKSKLTEQKERKILLERELRKLADQKKGLSSYG